MTLGSPVRYGSQDFRKRVYFMHPGFIDYMKRVLSLAIRDFDVDLIHFDNTSIRAQPAIFHHPMAVVDFRAFLTKKYSPELLKRRLGFSDVRFVEPPIGDAPMRVINDPLYQEWTDFRCQQMADFYETMATHIRNLDPEVAVVNNPHRGLSGHNTMWEQGVDYPRLLAHTDMVWTEEGNAAAFANDILISKIRSYKMARTLNNRILTYTSDSRLEMAEALAYNRQGMGMVGGLAEMEANSVEGTAYALPEEQKAYIQFFHRNFQYYRDVRSVPDVAVLRSFATMAYNNGRPYQSTLLFEQSLIQANIPFDIIFDDQLKHLSKYKVLILADQECLDDAKLDLIRSFVETGGGLVATEHTSLYTEWRQRKRDFALQDFFHVNAPEWHGSNQPEAILDVASQRNQIGGGRVVYIPEIQAVITKPPAAPMTSQYWKLPHNWKELIESVHWASDDRLSLAVDAPLYVTSELMEKADGSALMLHLLNFNFKETAVQNIKVKFRIPEGMKIREIVVLTPDGRPDEIPKYEVSGNDAEFTVASLSIYNMVVIKLA